MGGNPYLVRCCHRPSVSIFWASGDPPPIRLPCVSSGRSLFGAYQDERPSQIMARGRALGRDTTVGYRSEGGEKEKNVAQRLVIVIGEGRSPRAVREINRIIGATLRIRTVAAELCIESCCGQLQASSTCNCSAEPRQVMATMDVRGGQRAWRRWPRRPFGLLGAERGRDISP